MKRLQRFQALFLFFTVKLPYKNMEKGLSEQDRKKMEPVVFDKAE